MIRSGIKRVLKSILGIRSEGLAVAPEQAPAPTAGAATSPPPVQVARPRTVEATPAREGGSGLLSFEAVQATLEESVRPALQADGGDIELLSVEAGIVRVRLRGACQGCASSSVTLRLGVEALLREEFPDMVELVEGP
jgi:Fe-S cluster biogenesis protein NfuA